MQCVLVLISASLHAGHKGTQETVSEMLRLVLSVSLVPSFDVFVVCSIECVTFDRMGSV